MENISLNSNIDNESGFDLTGFWESVEAPAVVEVEVENPFVTLTKKLLAEAEAELAKWEAKDYKKSKGSVFVGGELEGGNYSYNYINNKRRSGAIRNAQSDIAQYKKDLGI